MTIQLMLNQSIMTCIYKFLSVHTSFVKVKAATSLELRPRVLDLDSLDAMYSIVQYGSCIPPLAALVLLVPAYSRAPQMQHLNVQSGQDPVTAPPGTAGTNTGCLQHCNKMV